MNYERTGQLIAGRRKELGLTQIQLAEKIGVSNRAVSKWERGSGFPDVALLVPLADELGVSVVDLLEGEQVARQDPESSVRSAVSAVYRQTRQKLKKNLVSVIASVLVGAFVIWLIWAILEMSGAFLKKMDMQVAASVYENGEAVEETTVNIAGKLRTHGRKNHSFTGTFHIECVEETGEKDMIAHIVWDSVSEGFHEITWYRPGHLYGDMGVRRYLYISRDMKEFALELEDGRIIATRASLAALESVEGWRYNVLYTGFFYNGHKDVP